MPMGRPRERNKDLPPFLHRKGDGRFFYLGPPMIEGKRTFHAIEARERDKAIDEYWIYRKANDSAESGTFGELIDAYMTHPYGLADVGSEKTREGYRKMITFLRDEWGDKPYAKTAEQSMKHGGMLKVQTFDDYLRSMRGKRGAIAANRKVRLVSAIFTFAHSRSMTTFNPTFKATYNPERPAKVHEDRDALAKVIEAAAKPVALMCELASVTSLDQGRIRLLTKSQVGEMLDTSRSKTGVEQEWEITPYVRSIFDRAKQLPGYHKSIYMFPRRNGEAYDEQEFQSAWRYARKKAGATFQFRHIRKWNIQEVERIGDQNTQSFAGHKDRRTTERHYLNNVKRARPLK